MDKPENKEPENFKELSRDVFYIRKDVDKIADSVERGHQESRANFAELRKLYPTRAEFEDFKHEMTKEFEGVHKDIKEGFDNVKEGHTDHEDRLRSLEKNRYLIAGGIAVGASLLTTFGVYIIRLLSGS